MSRKTAIEQGPERVRIDALADDGRGIARIDGKVCFVDGALPGETLEVTRRKRRRRHDEAGVETIVEASPDRVEPGCEFFGYCGGCTLQHLASSSQIAFKQAWLLDNLRRLGGAEPGEILPPITGPVWGYRRKARLGVKDVPGKGRVLVGFRERRSSYVALIDRCEVLHPSVGDHLLALSELVGSLEARSRVPQIEVAVGDNATALVFRHLDPLSDHDLARLRDFGRQAGYHVYLQPKGPDTVHPLWPEDAELYYRLEAYGLELHFQPTEFTQVNADINARTVERACELLEPGPGERILDLFCGIGNFSLPLAKAGAQVTGVEGDAGLVARARDNAARNAVGGTTFHTADLEDPGAVGEVLSEPYDKVLLDPPRSGAASVVSRLGGCGARRVVYISCHPATLARDTAVLTGELGYRLRSAGVMDMFPHTAHVESIAVFERRSP